MNLIVIIWLKQIFSNCIGTKNDQIKIHVLNQQFLKNTRSNNRIWPCLSGFITTQVKQITGVQKSYDKVRHLNLHDTDRN